MCEEPAFPATRRASRRATRYPAPRRSQFSLTARPWLV